MSVFSNNKRVVSGMRASGALHLGHYHGVLKNWVTLQHQYDCYFFVADLLLKKNHQQASNKKGAKRRK